MMQRLPTYYETLPHHQSTFLPFIYLHVLKGNHSLSARALTASDQLKKGSVFRSQPKSRRDDYVSRHGKCLKLLSTFFPIK